MVLSQNTNMYSDGSLEDRIIGYLKEHRQYADRIIKDIPEGAVFHNFSAARENLLRWYPFDSQDEVLEIGAGMGALTPYLCSVCRHVTAVEPSQRRAEIISLRCNEMDNVQIVNGTIHDIVPERLFDKILLIGVLEYAGISGEGQDPWLQLLTEARAHLKPTGKLLLAIENRCGLKYWCGAAEDHTGIPFDSLNNYEKSAGATERYQGQNGVRTFDRETLQKLLSTSGFAKQKYYYPLPDYKFPMLVLSDNSEDAAALAQDVKYSYSEEAALVANESELIATVIENNCLGFFANSFFVEAMTDGGMPCSILTSLIKRDYAAQYRIATVIKNDTVQRLATSKESVSHLRELEKNTRILIERGVTCVEQQCNEQGVSIAPRIMLPRADAVFAKAVETDNTALAYEMLERLREALLKSGQAEVKDGDTILEKGFLDMTFRNSFWNGKELLFFDQEWKENKVPLKYLLYRSIHYACRAIKQEMTMPFYRSCKIQPEDMDVFEQREHLFLKNLMDPINCQWFDGLMYQERLTADAKNIFLKQNNERLTRAKERLQGELKRREGHIELLLQSERDLKAETKRQDIIIAKLEDELRNKTGWVEQLMQSERELKQEVLNKEGHIQLLLKSDRELNRIKSSRSWRFMEYFWRLRDFLIPQGSRRRLAGKVLVKFVKHPLRFLSKCTPKRIRKFFSTVQREGVDGTSRRLNDCLTPASLPETQIALEPVNVQAVKSVKDYERLTVPQWENPAVSIVIPVYNQFDFTYACIKSILGNSGEASYEIIIADDCSMDLTVKIKEIISGLRVIRSQKNLRFLLNCNHAAKQAKGQYILFLNNDTQVQENWLQPLLDLMNADDSIGLIGSKLVYPDGRLQEAGGILWRDGSAWNYGNRSDPALPEYNYVKEADYISGASIMIRRALWEKIGGFDDRFAPAYCEDSDLAFEVRRRGYQVLYQPLSVVVHFEGVSNGTDTANGQKAYQVTNQKRFYEKWKNVLLEENFPDGQNVFLARDRSRNKKTLLMVDHYVPMYDKDAGSRTVFQYIKLFVDMGYNVKFIGDNFYPHQPYTQTLQQLGVEVLIGPYYAKHWKDWLKENGANIGYAFLNRPHIAADYIEEIRKHTNARIIYYGHDLHFLRERREYELTGDAGLLASSEKWKQKELALMRKADVAYYPSYIEKEEIQQLAPDVNVKAIPAYLFSGVEAQPYHAEMRRDAMFIGGFGHRPNVDAVKWLATEVMPHLLKRLPELTVYILGSNPPDEVKTLESEHLRIMGFVTDEELERYYSACRLDLVPLRYGAGIKGKVVEAMRYGMPVVTTSVGAEGISGADSILTVADSAEEFAQKAASLYQNGEELTARSAASYRYIRENFSPENARQIVGPDFDME